jgi:large subunit ribosomal protein L4
MKVKVFNEKGKALEEMEVSKDIFGVEPNQALLAQYIRVFQNNQRQGTSSTKTRGEVSGGGKKPWKQKGTGRARVGSSRSPIWRHGGISHGPKPKDWSLAFPKQMKTLAMKSALSFKCLNDSIKVLESFNVKEPKTKEFLNFLKELDIKGKILLVSEKNNTNLLKSVRNIKGVTLSNISVLNAYEVLHAKNIIFLKDAVHKLEEKYATK